MNNFKKTVYKQLGYYLDLKHEWIHAIITGYKKTKFKHLGENTTICPGSIFTYPTISIGHSTYVGPRCIFQSVHGEIEIGNHIMFGPGVHIHGGNHITNKVGVYMNTVSKEFGSDGKVIIEDDVWIGANAIILKGVTVGEGAVVAAGSIVTKDVLPYSIVAGSPAKVTKMRFTDDQIKEHKKLLSINNQKNNY
jgi:acetyltransferase-like isoleucine patch superfamily enzyme